MLRGVRVVEANRNVCSLGVVSLILMGSKRMDIAYLERSLKEILL